MTNSKYMSYEYQLPYKGSTLAMLAGFARMPTDLTLGKRDVQYLLVDTLSDASLRSVPDVRWTIFINRKLLSWYLSNWLHQATTSVHWM